MRSRDFPRKCEVAWANTTCRDLGVGLSLARDTSHHNVRQVPVVEDIRERVTSPRGKVHRVLISTRRLFRGATVDADVADRR